jgi:hypothetical protein
MSLVIDRRVEIVPPRAIQFQHTGTRFMAKKAAAPGNKSQAIREALAANPDKSPKEIAELLSAQGYKLNAQYVSTIKSNANKKAGGGRKVLRRKPGRPAGGGRPTAVAGMGTMEAAIAFVRAAGGLDQAKQTLAVLESIKAAL